MNVRKYIAMSVITAALIGMTGCSSDDDAVASGGTTYVPTSPTAVDSYEGADGDNSRLTAGSITVGGALQSRNTYPNADTDWVLNWKQEKSMSFLLQICYTSVILKFFFMTRLVLS